jgi:very-short-patch-repair endonuclease
VYPFSRKTKNTSRHHRTNKTERRDQEIDELLELRGWSVLHIPYDPPLTKEELAQVILQIKQYLAQ